MNINIYMFNDHLIYSNNLQDAFYQARVYQQQMLHEEKKKNYLTNLTEIVNELNKTINLIENNQIQLDEGGKILGVIYDAIDALTGRTKALRKLLENWQTLHPSQWNQLSHLLKEVGILYTPTRWTHPVKGPQDWIVKEVLTKGGTPVYYAYRWNGERWVLVERGQTPWGTTNIDGHVNPGQGTNPNAKPGQNGGWTTNTAASATGLANGIDNPLGDNGPAGGFGNGSGGGGEIYV